MRPSLLSYYAHSKETALEPARDRILSGWTHSAGKVSNA
jgi:hypothetical protein